MEAKSKYPIYVKCFRDARTGCWYRYIWPSMKQNPFRVILHFGTNDLQTEKTAEEITKEIINFKTLRTENNDVIIERGGGGVTFFGNLLETATC